MKKCRFCEKIGDWPQVCMSTRDMEDKPADERCRQALLAAGGGEYSVNQEAALVSMGPRDTDVLRTRLSTGRYNFVCEDDLITPKDLQSLLDENDRLQKCLADALVLLGTEMLSTA